jgi:hypothetical protein
MLNSKSLSLILIAGAILSLIAANTGFNFVYAQSKFRAKLDANNEVPPVNSTAEGVATFKVKDDTIKSKINITGISDVTMAHIHAGKKGENGDPIVDLLKTGDKSKTATGVMIEGNFTASDLQGPMKGKALTDLQSAMATEDTYVNIHTPQHPDGEIRGQIEIKGNATETPSVNANDGGADQG